VSSMVNVYMCEIAHLMDPDDRAVANVSNPFKQDKPVNGRGT
jgi:hypothetical protein